MPVLNGSTFEVPLTNAPQRITTSLGSTLYQLTVRWNVAMNAWMLDIADSSGNNIVTAIPLVTGVNLLEQYDYLNFGVLLFAFTDSDLDAPPTFDNLGSTGHLYFYVPGP